MFLASITLKNKLAPHLLQKPLFALFEDLNHFKVFFLKNFTFLTSTVVYAAYTYVEEKNVKFLKKRNLKWFKSSKRAKRGFCNKCGASLFFKVIGGKVIHIAAGMFNGPTKLKTINNIFVKGKLDYYKLDSRLPNYNRYPK